MDIDVRLREAIKHFWMTRTKQGQNQGAFTGQKDAGTSLQGRIRTMVKRLNAQRE